MLPPIIFALTGTRMIIILCELKHVINTWLAISTDEILIGHYVIILGNYKQIIRKL